MAAPIACPKCGTLYQEYTFACKCGHQFPTPKPFDVGKPFVTRQSVRTACPKCGSAEYKQVKPETMVAFTLDRICKACSTRYTPPTPAWARVVFGVIGLGGVVFAGSMAYWLTTGKSGSPLGYITPVVVAVVGVGCLVKAVTR